MTLYSFKSFKMPVGHHLQQTKRLFNFSILEKWLHQKNSFIDIHPKVKESLSNHKPLVALESTIITHGMPYPYNLETALEVEDIIRENNVEPATIAIINGRVKVGLENSQLKELAKMDPTKLYKCSRRDLPFMVSQSLCGGTTVAATMIIAHMAGLKIFATGGIGGVHRQGHETFDISADLIELGRTPITVVSSGIKSILDIPKTLEYLETQGVCVATYCNDDRKFPDFYTQDSGYKVSYNLASPKEAAHLIEALQQLDLRSGILIGVPIPSEFAADKTHIEEAIEKAYEEAKKENIYGKALTPFLLSAVSKITKGTSLKANMALIRNNAKVASKISAELYRVKDTKENSRNSFPGLFVPPIVIGASILDLSLTLTDESLRTFDGATYGVKTKQSAGGVGRNLAEGLFKLLGSTHFISVIGSDPLGQNLLNLIPASQRAGIIIDSKEPTSLCSLIFDKHGECKLLLGSMDIHNNITPNIIISNENLLKAAPLIIIDANLSISTIQSVLEIATKHKKPVFYEPTDMRIAGNPFKFLSKEITRQIKFISPNIFELAEIVLSITGNAVELPRNILKTPSLTIQTAKELLSKINKLFDCIIVTLGEVGVIVDHLDSNQNFFNFSKYQLTEIQNSKRMQRFYPSDKVSDVINVSGAGDSFSSGFIAAMLMGLPVDKCVALGYFAAKKALQSPSAVPTQYFNDDSEMFEFLKHTNANSKII